jgi:hypothetical protein
MKPQPKLSDNLVASSRSEFSNVFPGSILAADQGVLPKRFVYVLKGQNGPDQYYTGLTSNVAARPALPLVGLALSVIPGAAP